jgi:chorismate synthase
MKKLKKGIAQITDQTVSLGISMVVIALVLSAAAVGYFYVKSTSDISLLTMVINETKQLKNGNGYGTDDYIPALIKGGSISKSYTISGNKLYNKSGGQVTATGNGVGFIVTTNQEPQSDCLKIAKSLATTDLLSTKINSTTFTGEVTAAAAATACIDGDNTLAFTTKS